MRRHRRRAFSLIYLIVLMPLLGAAMTVATQVAVGILGLQGRITQQLTEDTRVEDLLRRLRHDLADVAWSDVKVSEDGHRLSISRPDSHIIYETEADRIKRSIAQSAAATSDYEITLAHVHIAFRPEPIADSGRGLVWISFEIDRPVKEGPDLHRGLATAVSIGRGGER